VKLNPIPENIHSVSADPFADLSQSRELKKGQPTVIDRFLKSDGISGRPSDFQFSIYSVHQTDFRMAISFPSFAK
jgi:hypothetical protein